MIIDPEFKALITPLRQEELAQLEANILADGCRDPLVTWQGILIDGHNRFAICSKHGLTFRTQDMEFPDREAAELWMIGNQMGRRNLENIDKVPLLERRIQGQFAHLYSIPRNRLKRLFNRSTRAVAGWQHARKLKQKRIVTVQGVAGGGARDADSFPSNR